MLSRYFPLLVTTIRVRTRGHFMSPGLWFASLPGALAVAVMILYGTSLAKAGEKDPSGWEFVGACFVVVEYCVLCWLPVVVGLHFAKERDRGQWLVFRDSAFSRHQLLLSIVIGSAFPEWAIGLLAGLLAFWLEAIPWHNHVWLLLSVSGTAIVAIYLQVRRFDFLVAPQLVVFGKLIAILALGAFVVPTVFTALGPYISTKWIEGVLYWTLMSSVIALLWVRSASILNGESLQIGILFIRLLAAPAIAGLLFFLPKNDFAVELPHAYCALLGLVLADAVSTLWERDASSDSIWSSMTIRAAFMTSFAVANAIWVAAEIVHEKLPNQTLIAANVVLGAVGRLSCYFLLQSWLRKSWFRWQSAILALVFVVFEFVLPLGLIYGDLLRGSQSGGEVASFEYMILGGLAACSSFGHMTSLQSLSRHQGPWIFTWIMLLSPMLGLLLLKLLLATIDRISGMKRNQQPQIGPLKGGFPGTTSFKSSRSSFSTLLANASPLFVALALRSRRRISVLGSPVQVLAFFSALSAIIAMVLSLYRGGGMLTADLMRSYGLWLVWSQYLLLMAALATTFTVLRQDRKAGFLTQHIASGLSAWRIAVGYLFGPASAPLRLAAIASAALLILGWVSRRTVSVVHQQLSMLLFFVVLNAVVARTEAGRFVMWSADGAVRSAPKWRPFGAFVLMITVTLHVVIAVFAFAASVSDSKMGILGGFGTEFGRAVKQMSPQTAPAFHEEIQHAGAKSIVALVLALGFSTLFGVGIIAQRFRIGLSMDKGIRSLLVPALILMLALPKATDASYPFRYLGILGLISVSIFGHSVSSVYRRIGSRGFPEGTFAVTRQDLSPAGMLLAVILIATAASLGNAELRERILDWGVSAFCGLLVVLARLLFYSALFRYLSVTCERWRFFVSIVCYFGLEFVSIVILVSSTTRSISGLFSAVGQTLIEFTNLLSADGTQLLAKTNSELAEQHIVSIINIVASLAAASFFHLLTVRRAKRIGLSPADAPHKIGREKNDPSHGRK